LIIGIPAFSFNSKYSPIIRSYSLKSKRIEKLDFSFDSEKVKEEKNEQLKEFWD